MWIRWSTPQVNQEGWSEGAIGDQTTWRWIINGILFASLSFLREIYESNIPSKNWPCLNDSDWHINHKRPTNGNNVNHLHPQDFPRRPFIINKKPIKSTNEEKINKAQSQSELLESPESTFNLQSWFNDHSKHECTWFRATIHLFESQSYGILTRVSQQMKELKELSHRISHTVWQPCKLVQKTVEWTQAFSNYYVWISNNAWRSLNQRLWIEPSDCVGGGDRVCWQPC